MGLETSTFIAGLTASNPIATDQRKQGDDHLRLIKGVLQSTFPNADRAFYFPEAETIAINETVVISDDGRTYIVDTSTGDKTFTLPAGLTVDNTGWHIRIIKIGTDVNGVKIAAASGNVTTPQGALGSSRVGISNAPVTVVWSGAGWYVMKDGPRIGTVEEYYGLTLQPGYVWAAGGYVDRAIYVELDAAIYVGDGNNATAQVGYRFTNTVDPNGSRLASGTYLKIPDRRGTNGIGADNAGGVDASRLSNAAVAVEAGTRLAIGSLLGAAVHSLTIPQLPAVTPAGAVNLTDGGHSHTATAAGPSLYGGGGANYGANFYGSAGNTPLGGPAVMTTSNSASGILSAAFAGTAFGGNAAHNVLGPSTVFNPIMRAC